MPEDLEFSRPDNPNALGSASPEFGEGTPANSQLEELELFVGSKADYYLRKWSPLLQGRDRSPGFNWAAFLFSGLWLPYRKMYRVTCIFYGIIFLELILEEVWFVGIMGKFETPAELDRIVNLAAAGICGALGNRWYLSHARKVISEVRAEGLRGEAFSQTISKRGDVSLVSSFGFFFLLLASLILAFMLLDMFLSQMNLGAVVEINDNDEVYYSNEATEADARALGEILTEYGIFGEPGGASVKVVASSGIFVVSFVLINDAWEDPEIFQFYQELGESLASDRFGRPLTIDLCNEYFEVQKSLRIE